MLIDNVPDQMRRIPFSNLNDIETPHLRRLRQVSLPLIPFRDGSGSSPFIRLGVHLK
jgi:hypothetical protein